MARTSRAALAADAEHAFRRALASLGHRADAAATTDGGCDVDATVDGIEVGVALASASVITPEVAARMVASTDRRSTGLAQVAIGDLVTAAAQDTFRDAGWGWLDRRGHLVLRAKGIHIDTDVPADERRASEPRRTISGSAAISWAVALLLSPEDPPSMRGVARRVAISHSAIVAAAKRMRAASLVRADGRPLVPELFWALAEEWSTTSVALAHTPATDDDTYVNLDVNLDGDGPGWAVAGTVGAVAWGAPMAMSGTYPPDFYVPSQAVLRQATLRLGPATRFEDRACTVALAPTPLVCAERYDRAIGGAGRWRFAHGLVAALDLAQDRARGAEILADWDPEDFTRVW